MRFCPIPGFAHYFAGQDGVIYCELPQGRRKAGKPTIWPPRPLKPYLGTSGYFEVKPYGKRSLRVHIGVLLAFTGPRPEGFIARHRDGNKLNNKPSNLSWDTYEQNFADAVRDGWRPALGERSSRARLTEDQVREIRRRYALGGETHRSLAQAFGVFPNTIQAIIHRVTWRHVR